MKHQDLTLKNRICNIISWLGFVIFIATMYFTALSVGLALLGNLREGSDFGFVAFYFLFASVVVHSVTYLINGNFKFLPWKPTK
jgi:hypothetical protein